ncbi:hypothetical protein M7I_1017 [Glarea lozoyensis 74030]|uniref:Uncharacterized protein n=1 Tax=Glarea lozoyensis (strain ATCC 74030 / MF5533) TaxID=1104152 RepID=H0EEY0_GLAL7|nr:hypothetical protein M7I_1017 [Glarea lozoyensis 74030]
MFCSEEARSSKHQLVNSDMPTYGRDCREKPPILGSNN